MIFELHLKNEGEKMELYSTYIETDKFDEVVNFYEKAFEKICSNSL